MVIYDLVCANEHSFEGWFKDLPDLEYQLKDKLISCPICGSDNIVKKPSTFAMVKKNRIQPDRELHQHNSSDSSVVAGKKTVSPQNIADEQKKLLKQYVQMTEKVMNEFDDVGADFTNEALKMHYGTSPKRNIRGLSTESQEELLKKEGIEFFKLPVIQKRTSGN